MFKIVTLIFIFLASAYAAFYDNIKGERCLSFYTFDYKYKSWYNMTENMLDSSKESALVKFYVQAARDAHILLSPEPLSMAYEIVLGAGTNTFCDIRKAQTMESMVAVTINNILDKDQPLPFWIRVSQSGLIEVGKGGESLPFIFWTDPDPIPVKYFSFSSYDNVVSKWMFRCRPITNTSVSKTDKFLTQTERLRKNVLRNRNAYSNYPTMSDKLLNVALTSSFKFLHLDVMTSILTLRGYATFEWNDNGIRWDPSDYKNISKLHLSHYELWQPELVLHNALDPNVNMFSEAKISVDNNGKVVWKPKFEIKTKCNVDLKLWPWDEHVCTVILSTWSHKISNVFYEIKENDKSKCFEIIHSDWKLDEMASSYVQENTPWDDILASVINENSKEFRQVSLQLTLKISRNTKILEKLFYVPLLLISFVWLSSFCSTPIFTTKITTVCVSVILLTSIIFYMMTYVPFFTESPPNLLIAYLKLMLLISTDTFISSILITIKNSKTIGHPPFILTRFLTIPVLTKVLILPKLEPTSSYNYSQTDGNSEEHEATITLWDIVIVAFERILFITYFVISLIIISSINISIKPLF